MKKPGEKAIKKLLFASIFLNILFFGYGVRKLIKIYYHNKAKTEISIQPDSVTFYVRRDEVFSKLPKDTDEIIMLGNSLTEHFEWQEIFRNVNIKNRGIGGDISKGILQRLNDVIESKPLKIFIMIGINDIVSGYPMDSVYNNYIKIIETIELKSPKTRIYIQSILPCHLYSNNKIIDLNQRLKDLCVKNSITYIDLYSKFVSGQILNPIYDIGDNIHLNGNGYLLWCSLIKDYINE